MRFVDSNVLLYAIATVPAEHSKSARAREILDCRDVALSVQVLQEFYVQATRRSRAEALDEDLAAELVATWLRFRCQETTQDLLLAAIDCATRFQISYWDAAIVEAARMSGCGLLLTEDLNDGQDYAGVVVENPFKDCA